ncbi:hypothetical protein [Bradyrhizobium sp. AUGA SZCCT0042]|uniref:hypothetical protein n=1 Tax=Bradyrhizobium sp. AUGA SZCCT0042 TaxID=2807651 RepID=UPI001BA9E7D5|nr:hypothetical protein [Bradyrhizobium sp. AUGA SZCCT0042]MBR1302170.1 hypothetical protein [Bradyrhizobium sp. AUGA SZCCT0042]
MIYARDVADAWGWVAFRMITGFALIVFAFVVLDRQTAYLCLILLIALDLASQGATQALGLQMKALQQKLWMDELTNRIFFEELVDAVRAGGHVNVPELYKASSTAAAKDIKSYVEGEDMFLQTTSSKLVAAFWSFTVNVLGNFAVYGAAYAVASYWRTGSFHLF